MKQTEIQIEHIAALARLELASNEKELYKKQLTDVLGYVNQLGEASAKKQPFSHQSELVNVLRDDVVESSIDREDILRNAPLQDKGFVKVRAVL